MTGTGTAGPPPSRRAAWWRHLWEGIADTDTEGTVECEVQAGASDAEGCSMDASGGFVFFDEAAVLVVVKAQG